MFIARQPHIRQRAVIGRLSRPARSGIVGLGPPVPVPPARRLQFIRACRQAQSKSSRLDFSGKLPGCSWDKQILPSCRLQRFGFDAQFITTPLPALPCCDRDFLSDRETVILPPEKNNDGRVISKHRKSFIIEYDTQRIEK